MRQRRRPLRAALLAAAALLVSTAWLPHCDGEETFEISLFAAPGVNASVSSVCADDDNATAVELRLGCQVVNGQRVQFDCTEDSQLRLVTGYADAACTVEAAGGYVQATVSRDCTQLESGGALAALLASEYPKVSKPTMAYTAMPHSPCLTPFEKFEEDLGKELLDIFGLNNITNATDPVLYEVKELLFTYGIVFVGVMILLGLLLCICGYKFFWLTLFISGFAVCGYLGYLAWMKITLALQVDVATVAKGLLPCFLVCGIIGGFLAWKFLKLGIFVLGACFGGAIGYLLYMAVIQSFWSVEWGMYVVVGCTGLLFGIIFVFKHKFFIVVCTGVIGSFALVSGISFLVGYYPSLSDLNTVETNVNATTWQFWVFFGSFLGVAVLSIIIQHCIKKKDQQKKYRVQQQSSSCRTSPRSMTELPPKERNPFLKD